MSQQSPSDLLNGMLGQDPDTGQPLPATGTTVIQSRFPAWQRPFRAFYRLFDRVPDWGLVLSVVLAFAALATVGVIQFGLSGWIIGATWLSVIVGLGLWAFAVPGNRTAIRNLWTQHAAPRVQGIQWARRALMPTAPERMGYRIWRGSLIAIVTVIIVQGTSWAADNGEWLWWIPVVLAGAFWAWMVFDRWHPWCHLDGLLPDSGWGNIIIHSINIALTTALTYWFIRLGWEAGAVWFVVSLMFAWCAILWLWGPHPSCIHGEVATEDLKEFHLPVARRLGIIAGAGLFFVLATEIAILGGILYVDFVALPLKIAAVLIAVLAVPFTVTWWDNHFPQTMLLWTRCYFDVQARLLRIDTRPPVFSNLSGKPYVIKMDSLGGIGATQPANVWGEVMYFLLQVGEVRFDIIGGPPQGIFLDLHHAWFLDAGPGHYDSEVLRGELAIARFFVWAGDEGKDQKLWSDQKKIGKSKEAMRKGFWGWKRPF